MTNPLNYLQPLTHLPGRSEVMTYGARAELAAFVGHSVVPSTTAAYEGHWLSWQQFLAEETQLTDPLLRTLGESEKAQLVALFVKRRHDKGMRGKGAHAVTASSAPTSSRLSASTPGSSRPLERRAGEPLTRCAT